MGLAADRLMRDAPFVAATEAYRAELLRHCYRMLGSGADAEDLVQETYMRAWRGWTGFQGRSSVRVWLYREGFFDDRKPPSWFLHGVFA